MVRAIDLVTFTPEKIAVKGDPKINGKGALTAYLDYDGRDFTVTSDSAFPLEAVWNAPQRGEKAKTPVGLKLAIPDIDVTANCLRAVDAFVKQTVRDNAEEYAGMLGISVDEFKQKVAVDTFFFQVVRTSTNPNYPDDFTELKLWPGMDGNFSDVPIFDDDNEPVSARSIFRGSYKIRPCIRFTNFAVDNDRCTVGITVIALSVSAGKKRKVDAHAIFGGKKKSRKE